jgi:hypothetical protein
MSFTRNKTTNRYLRVLSGQSLSSSWFFTLFYLGRGQTLNDAMPLQLPPIPRLITLHKRNGKDFGQPRIKVLTSWPIFSISGTIIPLRTAQNGSARLVVRQSTEPAHIRKGV